MCKSKQNDCKSYTKKSEKRDQVTETDTSDSNGEEFYCTWTRII